MSRLGLLIILSIFAMASCQNQEANTSSVSDDMLCDCVGVDENGEWDGQLSEDCIDNYKERFGADIDKMHEWFIENCPDYKLKAPKQRLEI